MNLQQQPKFLILPSFVTRFVLLTVAACLIGAGTGVAQTSAPNPPTPVTTAPAAPAKAKKVKKESKKQLKRDQKVVASKDTKQIEQSKKAKQLNQLAGVDESLPDKELYDKSLIAQRKGHFDVARMDLQTLLNTYPDSQFQMRAKLAIADSWFHEGGSAALAQAESEYKDFQTFFPNVPEAAEAQMRVADIYYKQMNKPDRDYEKTKRAEEEYRTMILQYPDSTLVPEAKQKLREVQEVLATREAGIAAYYAQQENWAAAIARYQTLVDTYPLYSHSDDALIALGDAYMGQAARFEGMKQIPEAVKGRLVKAYDDEAAAAYDLLITRYPSMDRADDARDRLQLMHYPVPVPTQQAKMESQTLTDSRKAVVLSDKVKILLLRKPDVVEAARVGEPTMVAPPETTAPQVIKQMQETFTAAVNPGAVATPGSKPVAPAGAGTPTTTTTATPDTTAPAQPTGSLTLQDVPTAPTGSAPANDAFTNVQGSSTTTTRPSRGGTGVGLGIVGSTPADTTDATRDPNGGVKAVGPTNNTALPAVEKPAAAPDTINDVAGVATPPAAAPGTKPSEDKKTDSSTKKKKKGLKKLIP